MTKWIASLWTDVKCAGGTRLSSLGMVQGSLTESLDVNDSVKLLVTYSSIVAAANINKAVIRLDGPTRTLEFRLSEIQESSVGKMKSLVLTGAPILYDLARILIAKIETGKRRYFNLGIKNSTPAQFIDTFVLPTLVRYGYTWIARGTVNITSRHEITFDRWTPLQLLRELESRTGGELSLERNGDTNYRIRLEVARGSTAAKLELRPRRNLRNVSRTRRAESIRSAIMGSGLIPTGDIEISTIADNAWLVTAVSGNDITLADPNSADDPPCLFTNQFVENVTYGIPACYIEKTDGTITKITACTTGQVFTVVSGTGISVGQHVSIRLANGDGLTELWNPEAVINYGWAVGNLEDTSLRGERNWIIQGDLSGWVPVTGKPRVFSGAPTQSGPSYNLTGGDASVLIPSGTLVWVSGTGGGTGHHISYTTADATSDGSGNVTVTLNDSFSLTATGSFRFYPAGNLPSGWTKLNAWTLPGYRDATRTTQLTGSVNGAHTDKMRIVCDGFTINVPIFPGDSVQFGGAGSWYTVHEWSSSDGSGNITIGLSQPLTLSDNTSVTVKPPPFVYRQAPRGLGFPYIPFKNQPSQRTGVKTPAVKVRYDASMTTLWFTVGLTLWNNTQSTTMPALVASNSASSGIAMPRLALLDADSADAELAAVIGDAIASGSWQTQEITLAKAYTMTVAKNLRLAFYPVASLSATLPNGSPPGGETNGATARVGAHTFLRWIDLHLGSDYNNGPVNGAFANKIWHRSNIRLAELSVDPKTYVCSFADLQRMGWNPYGEELVIGGDVHLYNPELGIDDTVRLVGLHLDLVNPTGESTCTLDSIPPRLSARLAAMKRTTGPLYATVDLTPEASTQSLTTVPVTNQTLYDLFWRNRGDGSQQSDPGTGDPPDTGEVYLNPLEPGMGEITLG